MAVDDWLDDVASGHFALGRQGVGGGAVIGGAICRGLALPACAVLELRGTFLLDRSWGLGL